ncbi:hypothetical protein [Streptomyces sp. NPDC091209]|uniref:hypothetical protein n=1 Tax=Streptomyces sp. NPDC091209 TaxID=3365974 RepID=UPI00380520C2
MGAGDLPPPRLPEECEARCSWDLSTAPGWKLGGHEPWNHQGYDGPVRCGTCGSEMRFVAAIASQEWNGGRESWAPVGSLDASPDVLRRHREATDVVLGNRETMRVFACPLDVDHPVISDLM